MKITPAHDPNDYAVGQRHKLPFINILTDDGAINSNGGKFAGMMRYDAREAILNELRELGLFRDVKDNPMSIPLCRYGGRAVARETQRRHAVTPRWPRARGAGAAAARAT